MAQYKVEFWNKPVIVSKTGAYGRLEEWFTDATSVEAATAAFSASHSGAKAISVALAHPVPPPTQEQLTAAYKQVGQLQDYLLSNFKSETGNETPTDCAIRLLGKTKAKK